MSFPKLNRELTKHGEVIAKMRILTDHALWENYAFVFKSGGNKGFWFIIATKTKLANSDFLIEDKLYSDTVCESARRLCNFLAIITKLPDWDVAEGQIKDVQFARIFFDERPDLKTLILNGDGIPFAEPVQPASKPARIILPRSEWMAMHYPQFVAA